MRWAVAAAALSLLAACPKNGGGREAVPTDVDVEWPDAAVFPDSDQSGDEPEPAPTPDAASPGAGESAPSMSAGSDR